MSKLVENALVIGATGIVGQSLVHQLHELEHCQKIRVILRRPEPSFDLLAKVEQCVVQDFMQLSTADVVGFSHAFSCLGSTLKKAGSKAHFYHIDFEINAHFANLLQESSTMLTIVSAMGASAHSLFFYNQVKGKLENHIQQLNLHQLAILRPSLLLGARPESRLLEDVTQQIFGKISHFLPQTFLYKPVTAVQVAHTMVEVAQFQNEKIKIYDNLRIQQTK